MRILRPALALSPLTFAFILAACALGAGSSDSAESAHTAGEIEWGDAVPQMWAAVDRSTPDPYQFDKVAPAANPVEARVDAWVQYFDGLAREIVQSKTGHAAIAPAPHARVVISKTPYVKGQRVVACIAGLPPEGASADAGGDAAPASDASTIADAGDAGIAQSDGGPGPVDRDTLVILQGKTNAFGTNLTGVGCMNAPDWSAADGLRWFNGLGGFSVEDRGATAFVDVHQENSPTHSMLSDRVAIQTAGPAIYVSSAAVSALSESALAVTMAREVGRYHRALDTTATSGKYDFLYERSDAPGRPTPLADEATRDAFQKVHLPRFLIPTQKIHARLVPSLIRWMLGLDWDQAHPCYAAKHFLTDESGAAKAELTDASSTSELATSPLSSAARSAVLKWEPKATACIDALELTDGSGPGTFPYGKLNASATKLPRAWFLANMDPTLKDAAAGADLAAPTMRELVTRLETVAQKTDDQASDLEKKIRENRIGYYTSAQEADEIALELATSSGIAPRRVFDAMFELMALDEKNDPSAYETANVGVSVAECKSWFDAGFREIGPDGQERDIYVPWAPALASTAWCARVYDLLHEARAHVYAPHPVAGPFNPDTYGDVQTQATTLTNGAPTPPPPPPAPPVADAPDAGATVVPKPHVTGDNDDDGWEDDGWTPPGRPATVAASSKAQPKGTSGGCSVGNARADVGVLGSGWLLAVTALLRRRRRR